MTQEEKARAYDDAIKKAESLYKASEPMSGCNVILETLFPELKESEDERIRKRIIHALHGDVLDMEETTKAISWLEKQGADSTILSNSSNIGKDEQKHFDYENANIQQKDFAPKVEPKFKVGDWVIDKQDIVHQIANVIENVTNHTYCYDIVGGGYFNDNTEGVRLWTINDAKDGDVLANDNEIVIFKENNFNQKDLSGCMFVHCSLHSKKGYWYTIGGINPSNYVPATKEQRDLLFYKMKEAGYEWDVEKRELKKINSYCQENCKGFQETGKCFADGECKAKREAEQELIDMEEFINELSKQFPDVSFAKLSRIVVRVTKWAKSNDKEKSRVQPKQEWSEEDSIRLQRIIDFLWYNRKGDTDTIYQQEQDIDWLKSLRPQKCLIPSEEEIEKAAQEWDSKANFNPFYMTMEDGKPTGVKQSITTHKESFKAGIYWILKSLRRWKPSDEQKMQFFDMVCDWYFRNFPKKVKRLNHLVNLNKLKEE